MKKISTIFIVIFFLLMTTGQAYANPISEDTIKDTTTENTTNPNEPPHSVTIKYVDVDTGLEIAPPIVLSGKVGEKVTLDVKDIPNYKLSDVVMVNELELMAKDYDFPIKYSKIESSSSSTEPTTNSSLQLENSTNSEKESNQLNGDFSLPEAKNRSNTTETSSSSSNSTGTTFTSTTETTVSQTANDKLVNTKATTTSTGKKLPLTGENSSTNAILVSFGLFASLVATWLIKLKLTLT